MQSLCALAHYDFNMAGAYAYEQALLAIKQLGLPMSAVEEQFRRMAFNIISRNQDDHVKKSCAKVASMKRGRAVTIVNEMLKTVSRWRDYADEAGVSPSWRDRIQHTHRLKGF